LYTSLIHHSTDTEQARIVLNIPVPKVLSWSGSDSNAVESAYVLMEHARGTQLGEHWQDMEIDDKQAVIDELVAIEKKFSSIFFCMVSQVVHTSMLPGINKTTKLW